MGNSSRRQFLQALISSPFYPLIAAGCSKGNGSPSGSDATELRAAETAVAKKEGVNFERAAERIEEALIGSPADALDIWDFYPVAKKNIPPAHWGNLVSGGDDDRTRDLNADAFQQLEVRSRRLVDALKPSTTTRLLGMDLDSPIIVGPLSNQGAFHADAEVGTAKAARAGNHVMCISGMASNGIREIVSARADPKRTFFQCVTTDKFEVTAELMKRAEDAGIETVILTVDYSGVGGNRNTQERAIRADTRHCPSCHVSGSPKSARTLAQRLAPLGPFRGINLDGATTLGTAYTKDFLRRVRATTKMKVVLKGIVTAEDAQTCLDEKIDAIWISNHGGRQDPSGMSTIEALPEVAAVVKGRVPIVLDGGVRWGSDVFKALALGATAVALGRPQAWALGAFGQAGVERMLELMQKELAKCMTLFGTPSIKEITPAYVRWRPWSAAPRNRFSMTP
jgi:4-hydroxymandelate oxidase